MYHCGRGEAIFSSEPLPLQTAFNPHFLIYLPPTHKCRFHNVQQCFSLSLQKKGLCKRLSNLKKKSVFELTFISTALPPKIIVRHFLADGNFTPSVT